MTAAATMLRPALLGVLALQAGAVLGWLPGALPLAATALLLALWHPAVPPPARPAANRRATPRFALRCPVVVEVRGAPPLASELRDISEGGARLAATPALAEGSRGLLRIEGLALPVPFRVLGVTPGGEPRLRFDLEGLARDAFLRQFARLTEGAPQQG